MQKGAKTMSNRKKLIMLNIFIAAAILFTVVFSIAVGSRFSMHTRFFLNPKALHHVQVQFSNENVVKMTEVRTENNEVILDFEALAPGETKLDITFDTDSGSMSQSDTAFLVTPLRTIIASCNNVTFSGFEASVYALLAVLFAIWFTMLWIFADLFKSGGFSRKMVACGGIGLYTLVMFLYLAYKMLNNVVFSVNYLMTLITEVASVLLFGLTPVMLLLSVLLAVSNIWLMRHEGRRPVNTLGIVFAVFWALGMVFALETYTIMPFLRAITYAWILQLILVYILAYFECLFLSTVACTFLATRFTPPFDRDYIIILGCAICADGSLTPLLRGRVDSAVAFEKKQYEATGRHAVFVPSGGQGDDEIISEGEAMENYLRSLDIPQEQIVREDKSVNTMQNMQFSHDVICRHAGESADPKIAFATTNYHVFRGYILAQENGFDAKGISAKTKPYFYLNAFLREFVGLLVDGWWRHLAFSVLIIAFLLGLHALSMLQIR